MNTHNFPSTHEVVMNDTMQEGDLIIAGESVGIYAGGFIVSACGPVSVFTPFASDDEADTLATVEDGKFAASYAAAKALYDKGLIEVMRKTVADVGPGDVLCDHGRRWVVTSKATQEYGDGDFCYVLTCDELDTMEPRLDGDSQGRLIGVGLSYLRESSVTVQKGVTYVIAAPAIQE